MIVVCLGPTQYSPVEMVLDQLDHGVLDVLLVLAQLSGHLLLKLLGESLDDHVAVGDLLPVELNEGQEAFLGAELALVIHILQNEIIVRQCLVLRGARGRKEAWRVTESVREGPNEN